MSQRAGRPGGHAPARIRASHSPTCCWPSPATTRFTACGERLALGDETTDATGYRHQWFVDGDVGRLAAARGHGRTDRRCSGLARHFRDHGQDPGAYLQADDIWSIARHRAFLCRYAQERAGPADAALASWAAENVAPLVTKWGHIAPLLMQASLALRAGRAASASVPDTLEALAELERSAARVPRRTPLPSDHNAPPVDRRLGAVKFNGARRWQIGGHVVCSGK